MMSDDLHEGKRTALYISMMCILCMIFLCPRAAAYGSDNGADSDQDEKQALDARKIIVDHVIDSYEWHLFDIGTQDVSIYLPVILFYETDFYLFSSRRLAHGSRAYKNFAIAQEGTRKGRIIRVLDDGSTPDPHASYIFDLSITKTVLAVFISSLLICLLFVQVGSKYRKAETYYTPRGLPLLFEPLIMFVRDHIAILAIGPDRYHRFMPYLLTAFFFIFINNLLGLVPFFPGGVNVTGNISVTFVLAMFTFFTTHWYANKSYWKHMFNMPGVPMFLKFPVPVLPVIEMAGAFIKPFTLMIRLFANMTAGHMVILSLTTLIFVLGSQNALMGYSVSPLAVLFLVFLNFLKILVSFLQAYIFTLFSAFFFGMAVPKENH